MTCPSCGVPIVPGYARCPKCHAALPRRTTSTVEGGTSLVHDEPRRVPLPAILAAGVLGLGIIVWLGVRHNGGGGATTQQAAAAPAPVTPTTAQPQVTAATTDLPSTTRRPAPETIANELQRNLGKQRLWSTVSVTGSRVDVRSGSCADAAMKPALDAAAPSFKAAGVTSLRCLEQSGAVAFTRDL